MRLEVLPQFIRLADTANWRKLVWLTSGEWWQHRVRASSGGMGFVGIRSRSHFPGKTGKGRIPTPITPFPTAAIARRHRTTDRTSRIRLARHDPHRPHPRSHADLRVARHDPRPPRPRPHFDLRLVRPGPHPPYHRSDVGQSFHPDILLHRPGRHTSHHRSHRRSGFQPDILPLREGPQTSHHRSHPDHRHRVGPILGSFCVFRAASVASCQLPVASCQLPVASCQVGPIRPGWVRFARIGARSGRAWVRFARFGGSSRPGWVRSARFGTRSGRSWVRFAFRGSDRAAPSSRTFFPRGKAGTRHTIAPTWRELPPLL